jgi:hypothetical protein
MHQDFGIQVFAPERPKSPPPPPQPSPASPIHRLVFVSPPRRTAPVVPVYMHCPPDATGLAGGSGEPTSPAQAAPANDSHVQDPSAVIPAIHAPGHTPGSAEQQAAIERDDNVAVGPRQEVSPGHASSHSSSGGDVDVLWPQSFPGGGISSDRPAPQLRRDMTQAPLNNGDWFAQAAVIPMERPTVGAPSQGLLNQQPEQPTHPNLHDHAHPRPHLSVHSLQPPTPTTVHTQQVVAQATRGLAAPRLAIEVRAPIAPGDAAAEGHPQHDRPAARQQAFAGAAAARLQLEELLCDSSPSGTEGSGPAEHSRDAQIRSAQAPPSPRDVDGPGHWQGGATCLYATRSSNAGGLMTPCPLEHPASPVKAMAASEGCMSAGRSRQLSESMQAAQTAEAQLLLSPTKAARTSSALTSPERPAARAEQNVRPMAGVTVSPPAQAKQPTHRAGSREQAQLASGDAGLPALTAVDGHVSQLGSGADAGVSEATHDVALDTPGTPTVHALASSSLEQAQVVLRKALLLRRLADGATEKVADAISDRESVPATCRVDSIAAGHGALLMPSDGAKLLLSVAQSQLLQLLPACVL